MTPARSSADSARERILAAALAEFSRHGIAGARVDRIAKAARTSKERFYAYFASKEELYRHVSAQELAAVAEATRLDPADLPAYAGRIHDYFLDHPDHFRLMRWGQLELDTSGDGADDAVRQSVAGKVEQLRRAQQVGQLDTAWEPIDILMFVNQIAMAWAAQPDLLPPGHEERTAFLAARRAAIVATVACLFPAHAG
ncbi:TetR family transcriptional regulator [Actinacidiphila rubida]|uniref:Transcriptional regulator, TetR family n=1 Tax=Actinacidiphila rubida TaxID=310780 RepID=A0A1H8QFK1_9ACTN|nr:TetR family transcriptional regulator [Actinacidiphila rubida]SEO52788.1 transcriptional regulator, TetR family [Actinacidiphila rubida]